MPATSDIQRCMSTVCEASAMVSRCGLYSPRGGGGETVGPEVDHLTGD